MTPGLDRLARSLRSPVLHGLYASWLGLCGGGGLPALQDIDFDGLPSAEHLALAEVEPGTSPASFRLLCAGAAMVRRAGRPLVGERIGTAAAEGPNDPMGGAAWAYRRVLASGRPSYEFAHFTLGDTTPMLFERLLLPLGRGGLPTHLIVASLFSESAQEPG